MLAIIRLVRDILKRQFLSGVLVIVPLILTYIILRFLLEAVDGILSPYLYDILGYNIPGLGIITTVLIIILAGFFVRSLIGSTLYKYGDRFLAKMPIVRIFYLAAKKLIEALTMPNNRAFRDVVMFEYPRRGTWAVGFATSRIKLLDEPYGTKKLVGVFLPSTPTPVSGIVIFVPEEDIIPLDISTEEGIKLIVSGGIVAPPIITKQEKLPLAED
jgi:uncharacterized membrane protein